MKRFIKFIIYLLIISIVISIIYFKFINNNQVLGYNCLRVLTGSMEPEIQVGENIIIKKCKEYNVGDIITYISNEGNLITHRIISINENTYCTKGDANNVQDPEPVLSNQIYGKVIFHFNSLFSNSKFSFAKYIDSNRFSINIKTAKPFFIVEGDKEILIDKYGSVNDYQFTVKNYDDSNISEVSFNYNIEIVTDEIVKTQLFYDGNLVDTTKSFTLPHSKKEEHKYLLRIEAPEDYEGKVKINVSAYQKEGSKS